MPHSYYFPRRCQFEEWTTAESGPITSALSGPNACIRRALCYACAAATSMCIVMGLLPKKMRPDQQKTRTFFSSPCFFPADSRSHPECAPHSKAIKPLMRFRLRLFFSSFRTPCLRSGKYIEYCHSGGGVVGRFS